ncbi:hypothetical protein TSUD_216540 [Trifolium subterraneum]|uniref:Acyl-coenzyme A thioesterase 13 n=1 Tax=Trifolium subterraneum TaxID=3900 RepID=A0A2Z6LZX5_TRISU|nr:hypothetical protein TSUD_216540 [Trifolium subterraneum]
MENAKQIFQRKLSQQESEALSRLNSVPSIRPGDNSSFYEHFALTGIKVEQVQPGLVSCSFIVPRRLIDSTGKLANGAIATLVDEVGGALIHEEGLPMNVSVDMSISFISTAHVNDELEITSRLLGRKGGYSGTIVLLKNKATGELIAEGRHSLFGRHNSKM